MSVLSILYVEDNHELRDTVVELLEADGREIVAMPDGESAISAWQARYFDVLVTDISLPGMSGTELARQILAIKPQQWVVFCSGYEYHQAFNSLGPHVRSIAKAFDCDDMDALLSEISGALLDAQAK